MKMNHAMLARMYRILAHVIEVDPDLVVEALEDLAVGLIWEVENQPRRTVALLRKSADELEGGDSKRRPKKSSRGTNLKN
jgi:hypothetical protein